MSRAIVVAVAAALPGLTAAGCKPNRSGGPIEDDAPPRPAIDAPWSDAFERAALGPDWLATDDEAYRIEAGALRARGARNHPVWLRRAIPRDAVVELDAWAAGADGDIKVELYGDGRSYDPDEGAYLSTGYVLVMGGWRNSLSAIARLDEHGRDRIIRDQPRVEPGRHYHWMIVRKGNHLDWTVDGQPFLAFDDPSPLAGAGHDHLAFADWLSEVHFDNLKIAPSQ